jgi:hypothetical protein
MGLLSKLFCKEEPPTASSVPAPTASTDEPYVPFVERRYVTVTCAGCGAQKEAPSQYELGDWRTFTLMLKPDGVKRETVVSCKACRPVFDEAVLKRDVAYKEAMRPYHAEQGVVNQYRHNWDRVNPRPKLPAYPTKEVWVRRTVCGCCGLKDEREVEISKTPGSVSWPRVGERWGGAKVCPACYDKPEHVALRSTLDELQERRDAQVSWRYREAAKLSVPWPCPEFPAGARLTERLKKAFGL